MQGGLAGGGDELGAKFVTAAQRPRFAGAGKTFCLNFFVFELGHRPPQAGAASLILVHGAPARHGRTIAACGASTEISPYVPVATLRIDCLPSSQLRNGP